MKKITNNKEKKLIGVDKSTLSECILTTRALMSTGYAQLKYQGKLVYQHRLAYAEHNGLDVFNLGGLVLHKCDVRNCVNPDHLFLGSYQDNMTDKVLKGRQTKGTATGRGVLTDEDRKSIRERFRPRSAGVRSNIYELSEEYKVALSSIYRVVKGQYA